MERLEPRGFWSRTPGLEQGRGSRTLGLEQTRVSPTPGLEQQRAVKGNVSNTASRMQKG